jgi:HSP20 family molecular chaperone IbpA
MGRECAPDPETPASGRIFVSLPPPGRAAGRNRARADLPGLKTEDVHLEIEDNALHLEGERRQEQEEKREGFYRSERVYGRFSRTIPLP